MQSYSCTHTPSKTRERERVRESGERDRDKERGRMLRQDHKNRAMCYRDNKVPPLSTYNSTKSNVIKPPQSIKATNEHSCKKTPMTARVRSRIMGYRHVCVQKCVGSCLILYVIVFTMSACCKAKETPSFSKKTIVSKPPTACKSQTVPLTADHPLSPIKLVLALISKASQGTTA